MECRYGTLGKLALKDGKGFRAMKVVILAGGKGTRISEESRIKPKPMVEIAGRPILWHIMKIYSAFGYHDFIICCCYKGHMIKEFFTHYYRYQTDSTFNIREGTAISHNSKVEPWRVTLADTGYDTPTAGRILRVRDYIDGDTFMLTYGDGVADVDLVKLLEFHQSHGRAVTITTTQPEGRFGAIKLDEAGIISGFKEKARKDQSWINAGYMVCSRDIFEFLGDGGEMLEAGPFEGLARQGQMAAYRHPGFWSPMDNIHDRDYLQKLWEDGKAPWKVWENAGR